MRRTPVAVLLAAAAIGVAVWVATSPTRTAAARVAAAPDAERPRPARIAVDVVGPFGETVGAGRVFVGDAATSLSPLGLATVDVTALGPVVVCVDAADYPPRAVE